ncbi:MAG: hypothetical protein ACLTTU_06775 [Bilophila wadsworthia]
MPCLRCRQIKIPGKLHIGGTRRKLDTRCSLVSLHHDIQIRISTCFDRTIQRLVDTTLLESVFLIQ